VIGTECANAANRADAEVEGKKDEDEERSYLERETSDHDVVAHFWILVVVRLDRSDATSCSLQNKREEVAGDEDARVPDRFDT